MPKTYKTLTESDVTHFVERGTYRPEKLFSEGASGRVDRFRLQTPWV